MESQALAEWSRYIVGIAVFGYLGSWLMLCAEAGLRGRMRREAGAATQASHVPAMAGAGASPDSFRSHGQAEFGERSSHTKDNADRLWRLSLVGIALATVTLAVGVVMRGLGTGRVPWGNMYEFSITGALVASVVFLILTRKDMVRALSVWVILLIFITLGLAITALYVPPGPLVPALQSYWLVLHVGCAVTAFGLFTVAAVVSGAQIVAERSQARADARGLGSLLPSASLLDRLSYRLNAIAFPIWTFGPLILGSIWAEVSWGRYWGWDPKEVWALITWLVYAAYLHARATAGWKGSKASIVSLCGYATMLFSYFGVNIWFNGLHSYGGL